MPPMAAAGLRGGGQAPAGGPIRRVATLTCCLQFSNNPQPFSAKSASISLYGQLRHDCGKPL